MTDGLVFDELWRIICERADVDPGKKSYVRHLLFHEKGIDKPLEKVGEEACEFVLAVKNGHEEEIVGEAADLLFHMMVALKAAGVDFKKVEEELEVRQAGMHLHD
ncbi:Phosphoribosyl-ATP pyrophosphatase [Methanocorpusculaceae archaeon Sp1]|uniref:Phosphoribosyl-ATP pyrophosphatase n=1 Tax=Methanorbis furvi TaxID=3028299 RepID=A0AAE4MDI2_9EURY|nr:Phosphoribosyl-ATP pyrophosphatase [Methanocorpusculaceae archaeon Sp1]MDV0442229.1 Phosphoribosyl-ATP pyrophosphatase [Methanocorpusculaceae archaeon Ag1]